MDPVDLASAVMYQEEVHQSATLGAYFSSTQSMDLLDQYQNTTGIYTNQSAVSDPGGDDINKFYFYKELTYVVMWFLFVAIVVGNSCVIAALLLSKARKSRMNYFIMQLAIADLSVGLISVSVDIAEKIAMSWLAGNFACKLLKYLQAVVTYSSTYVLVALSIDRCDAITNPMNFSGSWKRAKLLTASAWLLSFLLSTPQFIFFNETLIQDKLQCWIDLGAQENWRIWIVSICVTLFVIPALTITACYTVIVLTIWAKSKVVISPPSSGRRLKRSRQVPEDIDSRRASSRGLIPRAKIKTVKMTFVIVFVFVLCWSPYMVFDILQVFDCIPKTQSYFAVATLIQSLAPLNSAANPLIYCIFSTHIFNSLRRLPPFKWICCKRSGSRSRGNMDSSTMSEVLTSSNRQRRNTLIDARAHRSSTMRDRSGSATRTYLNGNRQSMRHLSELRRPSDQHSGKRVQLILPTTVNCSSAAVVVGGGLK